MPVSDQGLANDRYAVVPRTLVFLTRGRHILLILGDAHKRLWANLYNGIGGHVEPGEDILAAAYREVYEETGIILGQDILHLCCLITINTNQNPGICLFVFRGNFNDDEIPVPDDVISKEGKICWISLKNLYNQPLVDDLRTLLPRVLDWQLGDAIVYFHYSYDQDDKLVIRSNTQNR